MEPLRTLRVGELLARVSSSDPTPGGGAVACLVGALSAALGAMVIAVGRKKEDTPASQAFAETFRRMQDEFIELAAQDETAFEGVMKALRIPKADEDRSARLEASLASAADVPMRTAQSSLALLEELVRLAPAAGRSIVSDVGVAGYLAKALLSSSLLNVSINLAYMRNAAEVIRLREKCDRMRQQGSALASQVESLVTERIG